MILEVRDQKSVAWTLKSNFTAHPFTEKNGATPNVQVRSHLNSALSRVCLRQIFKKMETGTFRVLGERDNHYTTET